MSDDNDGDEEEDDLNQNHHHVTFFVVWSLLKGIQSLSFVLHADEYHTTKQGKKKTQTILLFTHCWEENIWIHEFPRIHLR